MIDLCISFPFRISSAGDGDHILHPIQQQRSNEENMKMGPWFTRLKSHELNLRRTGKMCGLTTMPSRHLIIGINQLVMSGPSHHYHLGKSTFIFKELGLIFKFYSIFFFTKIL